jgi:hypothetical protein
VWVPFGGHDSLTASSSFPYNAKLAVGFLIVSADLVESHVKGFAMFLLCCVAGDSSGGADVSDDSDAFIVFWMSLYQSLACFLSVG